MLDSCFCSWISHFLACMGNCIGCCVKSLVAVDEPSKGLKIQGQAVNKPGISDDYFWSTSTHDLDNSTFPSQKSLSSISVSTQSLSQSSVIGSSSNPEFVNHGLMRWNQSRLLWVGTQKPQHKGKVREAVLRKWSIFLLIYGTKKGYMIEETHV